MTLNNNGCLLLKAVFNVFVSAIILSCARGESFQLTKIRINRWRHVLGMQNDGLPKQTLEWQS